MKLVIDIPKHIYDCVIGRTVLLSHIDGMCKAIEEGVPLPKGHGDLKDADIYKAEVNKYITENKNSDDLYLSGCGDGAYHALHIYDCIPTIIEADNGGE